MVDLVKMAVLVNDWALLVILVYVLERFLVIIVKLEQLQVQLLKIIFDESIHVSNYSGLNRDSYLF